MISVYLLLDSTFHVKNTVEENQKHCGRKSKTLRERFQNTEGARNRSLSVL